MAPTELRPYLQKVNAIRLFRLFRMALVSALMLLAAASGLICANRVNSVTELALFVAGIGLIASVSKASRNGQSGSDGDDGVRFARQLVSVAEGLIGAMAVDVRDCRIIAANRTAASFWKQPPEKLLGKSLYALTPEYLQPRICSLLTEAVQGETARVSHVPWDDGSGRERYLDLAARPISPGGPVVLLIIADVTERCLLHRQLARQGAEWRQKIQDTRARLREISAQAERLQSLIANAPFAIITVSANNLQVLRINRRAEALLGKADREAHGLRPEALGFPKDELIALLEKSKAKGGVAEAEFVFHPAAGTDNFSRRLRVTAIYEGNAEEPMFHLVAQDVTEEWLLRHQTDQAYQQMAAKVRRLEDVNERLREESRARSFFLATLGHELRAPLNSILGFCEVLLEETFGPLTERQRGFITDMYRSAQHLLKLLNDVLDIARVDAKRVELRLEPIEVEDLLKEVEGLTRGMARVKKQKLNTVVRGEDLWLLADEQRAKQVLINLVS
ncbi:MAG: PAS domain-containing protein, partial [Armatimonadetes bacterium]|nr:PAS domain-containing protein [Armatimonadota bacterium]